MTDTFQFHFTGTDLFPKNIRAGEIAELLEAIEDVVFGTVVADHPQLSKDSLVVSLAQIQAGSLSLEFTSQLPEVVNPAFFRVSEAIAKRDFDGLPAGAIEPLRKIVRFIKDYDGQADLIFVNGKPEVLASLTADIELPRAELISGETVIYGEIVRVGGVEPKVEIKTINERTLYCPFERELAARLGALLYHAVGLKGVAQWDSQTYELRGFTVQDITEYRRTSIIDAFAELSELAEKYYRDIDDVTGYVSSLRKESIEP